MTRKDLYLADPERAARVANLAAHYARAGYISETGNNMKRKPVIANGKRYASSHDAAAALGYSEWQVRDVCRGVRKVPGLRARWEGR